MIDSRHLADARRWWESFDDSELVAQWRKPTDEGLDEPVRVLCRLVVCPQCEGRGRYVNPAIDSGGLGADVFTDDPGFARAYFRGSYDVTCALCDGRRVVPRPVNEQLAAEIEQVVLDGERDLAESAETMRQECGGWL